MQGTEETKGQVQADSFTRLRTQLAGLADGPEKRVQAGHLDLGPDIWLSSDPDGQAELICRPSGDGFEIALSGGDSGKWAGLGMRFGPSALNGMRYLGLLTALRGGGMVAFRPTLRYFLKEGGVRDVSSEMPVVLSGAEGGDAVGQAHFAHIPVEAETLQAATGCELNLFFLRDSFAVTFDSIEPLRIL